MTKGMVLSVLSVLGLFLIFAGGGCTHVYTAHGAYYRTRPGDTLESIARRYQTSVQDLAEVNNIEDSSELKARTSIYIPGVTPSKFAAILKKEGIPVGSSSARTVARNPDRPRKDGPGEAPETSTEKPGEPSKEQPREASREASKETSSEDSTVKTDRARFSWPIEGEISSLFGMRRGRRHDGIDIRAKTGTPVYAAADGEVVYAKRMRGYGNLVLVKHEGDFFTVYAHNSVNLVKVGTSVKKGQLVSRVGRTGRATGPHLHFEIREGAKARNPLFFMPKNLMAEKAKETKGVAYGGPDDETDGDVEAEDP